MKLTGNLKKEAERAEKKNEAKEIIRGADMELTDDEVDQVAGGFGGAINPCPVCRSTKNAVTDFWSGKVVCPDCGHVYLYLATEAYER